MDLTHTVLLGAIAGFAIYLGLPVARLENPRPTWQAFVNAMASGILVFLLWDILSSGAWSTGGWPGPGAGRAGRAPSRR